MFVFPCRIARQFVSLLKRAAPRSRDAPPFVFLHQDKNRTTLSSIRGEIGLRWHQAGRREPATLAFTADHLAAWASGTSDVTIVSIRNRHAEAKWIENGVERAHLFPTVESAGIPTFPSTNSEMLPVDLSLISALVEASRTTAKQGVRYAMERVQLQGKAGQVVATDGKQLLIQSGFAFPWEENLLVPATGVFASKELLAEREFAVGRTDSSVLVVLGSWTVALKLDAGGRYPPVADVIPRGRPASRCEIHPEDVPVLLKGMDTLPGACVEEGPVTLEAGEHVVVRASDDGVIERVEAHRSKASHPIRVACSRKHLARCLSLGICALEVHGPGKPFVARDERRTYVWIALDDSYRVDSPADSPTLKTEKPMPTPNGNGHHSQAKPPEPGEATPDLLGEAEAVRDLLVEASTRLNGLIGTLRRQRKQSRAFRQVVQSLRQLPSFDL